MIIVLSSVAHFPNAEGVVAPGMTCTYSVKFFPDSLADFEDEIKVSPAKNYSTRYQWYLSIAYTRNRLLLKMESS